jgi:2'-5' RNA ligase
MPVEIKNFEQFVNEQKAYEYGCAMVYFDFPEMQDLHSQIDENDVYVDPEDPTFGLEKEPHVTLLFGLHANEVTDESVMSVCKSKPVGPINLGNASIFSNEKYDVLKMDADNSVLHELNAELTKMPHTTSFPDYHPHSTIGYLKPGMGQKYVDLFAGKKFQVTPKMVVYTKPNGSKLQEAI